MHNCLKIWNFTSRLQLDTMLNTIREIPYLWSPCIILYVTSWERNYDHNDCDSERDEKKEEKKTWPSDFGRRTYTCVKNSWNMHWKGNAEKGKDLATKFHLK